MLKKVFIFILTSILIANSLITPFSVSAQATQTTQSENTSAVWYNQSFGSWFGKVYDPSNPSEIFGERYTAAQVQWVVYGLFAFLINSATGPQNAKLVQCFLANTTNINTCVDALKTLIGSPSGGTKTVERNTPSLLSLVFATDRPISGISYIKNTIQNFSVVPKANAQTVGFGFQALNPIQSMWRSVRDISYGLFVIAAIVLAFMIMFRVKISPQVVISVQSAIPKIIMALILVTFSYAIAGFLIDLMYIVIGFISLSFGSMGGLMAGSPQDVFSLMTTGHGLNSQGVSANVNFGVLFMGVIYIIAFIIGFLIMLFLNIGLLGTVIGVSVIAGIGGLIGPVVVPLLSLLGPLLILLIIIVIVMFFVKIVWSLLKAFANIVLLTIFAPLQIAAGVVVPNLGFGTWLKSYVSNLAVFVVTGTLFLFSFIFLGEGFQIGFTQFGIANGAGWFSLLFGVGTVSLFNPALSSASWPPLLGGGNAPSGVGLLLMGVSLVVFTLIPKANELIQSVMSGKPFAYGAAIGEMFGPAYGLTLGPSIQGLQRGYGEGSTRDAVTTLTTAVNNLRSSLGFGGTTKSGGKSTA